MERTGIVNNGGGRLAFSFCYLLTLDKCLKVAGLDPPRREARGTGGGSTWQFEDWDQVAFVLEGDLF